MSQLIPYICYIIAGIIAGILTLLFTLVIAATLHGVHSRNKQRARLIRRATRRW